MKKVNDFEHQVLKLIGLGIRSTSSIFDALTENVKHGGADYVMERLQVMAQAGSILLSAGKWEFAVRGFSELNHYELLAKQSTGEVRTVATSPRASSGQYDGAELSATCLRVGAYDFLACPSLVNNQRVMHRTSHLAKLGA
jgi:hypothetical protein